MRTMMFEQLKLRKPLDVGRMALLRFATAWNNFPMVLRYAAEVGEALNWEFECTRLIRRASTHKLRAHAENGRESAMKECHMMTLMVAVSPVRVAAPRISMAPPSYRPSCVASSGITPIRSLIRSKSSRL